MGALNLQIGRRTLLRGSALGAAGLATAALIGCGDDEDDEETAATTPAATAADGGASSSDDDGDTEAVAEDIEYPNGKGEFIQDPTLPYPYNFEEPAKAPKRGGIMRVGATWDASDLDPTVSAAGGTVTTPNVVYNRLVGMARGPKGGTYNLILEPELAQSWERSEDGMTFTFHIQPGVKWQNVDPLNGRAFTAEDARYALERYATEGVHKAYHTNVASYEAVDDLTLKVNMARPTADYIVPLASNKQTIFPRELVDDGTISDRVIGTGPMILKEVVASDHVSFERNPDYWEREVLLDGFDFKIMPDHSSRLAAFRAEQMEYAYGLVSTMDDVEAVLKTNPGVQINTHPVLLVTAFGMNLSNPKFADERIRRAISLSIDRELMIDVLYTGLGKALGVMPWSYLFDEEPTYESGNLGKWVRYDATEAKQLLAAAGFEDGFEMNNIFYPYTAAYEATPDVLISTFRESGINMTGGRVDYTEFNSQWVGLKLPEVSTSGWLTSGFDADNWFHGQIHSESGGNRTRINDPQIDEWAEAQQLELDPEARKEIWKKIWDRDLDQAYRPPMAAGFAFEVYQPWVRGVRWTGTSPNDNSYYYDWGDVLGGAWMDK